ncbi:hypothetical protein H4Q26_013324 [Puccinia striiformis f. sp. tritici PST-130]|nr:hypothetical protein H4Q26_013324 [Puccinia striiformis f. sp. tritici PST-130]
MATRGEGSPSRFERYPEPHNLERCVEDLGSRTSLGRSKEPTKGYKRRHFLLLLAILIPHQSPAANNPHHRCPQKDLLTSHAQLLEMLFKYLLATVALAASAASSPTVPTIVSPPATHLNQCQTVITEVKEPVVASCKAGKIEKVKSHLEKVQKPVKALSASFSYSSTLVIKKEIITKYSYEFIKVLRKFQSILTVISSHPKISASCTEVYAKFDYQFDSICTVFKSTVSRFTN